MVLLLTGGQYHPYSFRALRWQALCSTACCHISLGESAGPRLPDLIPDFETRLFDLLVVDICFPDCRDKEVIDWLLSTASQCRAILLLHASLHSFKEADSGAWAELKGADTLWHDQPVVTQLTLANTAHPVAKNLSYPWQCPVPEEVYEITGVHQGTQVLATIAGPDDREHPAVWQHQVNGIPVVAISPGHENQTIAHPWYGQLVHNTLCYLTKHPCTVVHKR